jgi:general secretion pathway protein J
MDEDLAAGAFGRALLLEGVDEFEISYFGTAEALEEPDWVSEWLDKPELPQAVSIHLTTEEQTWPDILVRLPDSQRTAGVARR